MSDVDTSTFEIEAPKKTLKLPKIIERIINGFSNFIGTILFVYDAMRIEDTEADLGVELKNLEDNFNKIVEKTTNDFTKQIKELRNGQNISTGILKYVKNSETAIGAGNNETQKQINQLVDELSIAIEGLKIAYEAERKELLKFYQS